MTLPLRPRAEKAELFVLFWPRAPPRAKVTKALDSPLEGPCPQVDDDIRREIEDANLKINVEWIKLTMAKEWGPYVLVDWTKQLADKCINTTDAAAA